MHGFRKGIPGFSVLVLLLAFCYSASLSAAPGDIVFEERFNNNGDYTSDWQDSGGDVDVSDGTFNSSPRALRLSGGGLTVTSRNNRIDAAVPAAELEIWIRRGSDSLSDSENPDAGEDLVFEYLNNNGVWLQLATYAGNGTPGEIYTPTFTLPADALHSGLRLRFRLLGGTEGFDYWHIDDIIITETSASTCDTYLDQFNVPFYFNSDGTRDWTANPWSEQDSGGLWSFGGLAFISGGELNLQGNNTTNNTYVVRQADTSASSQVTLSFDFSTQGFIESDDAVLIQVSNNGGISFTTLETITGLSGTPSGSRSYDITAYAATDMQVRIAIAPDDNAGSCCYNGGETFQVDNVQIETCVQPTPVGIWQLEASVWNGSDDEVEDSSDNGLHGAAVAVSGQYPGSGSTTPAIAGNPGTCRYGVFNGDNGGHLSISDNPLLDIAGELTVTAWIYPTGLPAFGSGDLRTIISKDENWEFHIDGNHQIFWWWGGGSDQLSTSGPTLTTGNWYHIAVTYTSGLQKIYINGVERASGNDTGTLPLNNDPLLIGADLGITARNFEGFIDEVRVYDGALSQAEVQSIMAQTHPCEGPILDHFAIDIGNGNASTCVPFAITITAEDSGNTVIDNYEGNISLSVSTNHGRWQKTSDPEAAQGTLSSLGTDDGAADYTFVGDDEGEITLELDNTHAETLTVAVTETATGVPFTSLPITFSENAFVVSVTDSLSNDIVAGRDHAFHIEMVRRDADTGVCGPATDYTVADIKAWFTRAAEDPNGLLPALETATETQVLPASEPGAANLTLPFVGGEADFALNTTDVGKYVLNFKDDSSVFSDQVIVGGSSTLVVRPFGFALQVPGNAGAVDASGGVFTVAGNNFSVNARAVAWVEADDTDNNGIPDGHNDTDAGNNADLSNNPTVPGFGQENPAESLRLSAYLLQPAAGADPGLSDGDASDVTDARLLNSFVNGAASTTQVYYDEVGIIELRALIGDTDYLGAGAIPTARMLSVSGYIGRFIPEKFALLENDIVGAATVQSSISESCGSFSYMGATFNATYYLAAVGANGNVTTNYRDAFARLTGGDTYSFGAVDQATGTNLSSRIVFHPGTVTDWDWDLDGNGVTDYGYGRVDSTLSIERSTVPDGPYSSVSIGVVPLETQDGVTIPPVDFDLDINSDAVGDYRLIDETDTALRFGRLHLASAFGPESADLPVTFVTEFWDGTLFSLNAADSCTAIASSAVSYPGGTIDTSANLSVAVGAGTTTGVYNNLSGGAVNFTGGDAGHFFSAPGAGNTGSFNVNVNLSSYPWLQYDWNQDGNYSDASLPTATYTFGSYRGHDRVIYWREEFE